MEAEPKRTIGVRALVVLFALALVVLVLDQGAKYLVVQNLQPGQTVDVLGSLLRFEYIRNSGAAFSIGTGSTWIFSLVGVAVLVFIIWFAKRIRSTAWAILFGLLLGGLLGNLGDRLFRAPGFGVGEVVDFLRIPLLPAVFNLADSAIVASMALFLVLTLLGVGLDGKRAKRDEPEPATEAHPASGPEPGPGDDPARRRDGGDPEARPTPPEGRQ